MHAAQWKSMWCTGKYAMHMWCKNKHGSKRGGYLEPFVKTILLPLICHLFTTGRFIWHPTGYRLNGRNFLCHAGSAWIYNTCLYLPTGFTQKIRASYSWSEFPHKLPVNSCSNPLYWLMSIQASFFNCGPILLPLKPAHDTGMYYILLPETLQSYPKIHPILKVTNGDGSHKIIYCLPKWSLSCPGL